ncbi:nitroreductase family protein [Planctomycetaceae bacterium SH139]
MRPRRVPFAKDYIGETVDGFCAAACAETLEPTELRWANDVLNSYFEVCAGDPSLDEYERRFNSHRLHISTEGMVALIPYLRKEQDIPKIDFDVLLTLAKYRRSVRWFLQIPVPRRLIDRAIVLGGYAPSACNRQPYEFRVIDDPDLVRKVARIPIGTGGYADNIPCMIVIVGQQRNYFDERDRHLIYIDGSLAAMSFIFALECQGLSSCCINWPEIASKDIEMADALQLDADERPVMCIAVGYPDPNGMVANSAKKALDVLRRYNFE